MKLGWVAVIFILLVMLVLLFWIHSSTRYDDDFIEMKVKLIAQDKRIEELEKELRLLKTDLDITKNGFPEKDVDKIH